MAKYILYNAKIYTQVKDEMVDAVAIDGKNFICVGTREECEKYRGAETECIDLAGKTVLPGFIDGHTHPESIATTRWRMQMPEFNCNEVGKMLEYVKKFCDEHPVKEYPFIFGECYKAEMFGSEGPNRWLLDKYVSDRPVRLQDFTDHACWYNSKALELMGVDKDIEDTSHPPFFMKDDGGELTGWVKEPFTQSYESVMYEKLGWSPPDFATEETVKPFLDMMNKWGVIAIGDAITANEEDIRMYYQMDIEGRLKMYYQGMCPVREYDDASIDECINKIFAWQKKYTSEHVEIHTAKIFIDGTNEMGNSASLEPLKNDPSGENFGETRLSEEELINALLKFNDAKIDVHVHVVCDRGFRMACDAYEKAKGIVDSKNEPWNIYMTLAHCELVHPIDMIRPAKLGIIINWSCHWSGGYFGDAAISYLGRKRWDTMYDFTKMIDSGAVVTYSSDVFSECEEHRANPFLGMQIAATRIDPENPLDPSKYLNSIRPPLSAALNIKQLVKGYTVLGAIPLRLKDRIGSIEADKRATLMILNDDIYEMPVDKLQGIYPERIMFDGEFII